LDRATTLLRVRGIVQGVGFRPFVLRVARNLGLDGWVRNDAAGVLVCAAGRQTQIDALRASLRSEAPAAARVLAVEEMPGPVPVPGHGFEIIFTERTGQTVETAAPPDLALCDDCRRELLDPHDRRHGYAFINCTQCGPRYSILEELPYDRPATTMRSFLMCSSCQREYESPLDRRFHAEPNACPHCGPALRLFDRGGYGQAGADAALEGVVAVLRAGGIVAVKGLGGFHLMCDATSERAVAELRRRKHRVAKPFAVMFRDLAALREAAEVGEREASVLTGPSAPIVLVPLRPGSSLAPSVAPRNPWVGALLPSTPLHLLLLAQLPFPVVATSANLAEEPLCTDDEEARLRLGGVADVFLGHNRPIARPVDDSVLRFTRQGTPILLRRARGLAPTTLGLPAALATPLLCVGAQMKNAVGVAAADRVVLSPHIGDLGNVRTHEVFTRTLAMLSQLHRTDPGGVVHDKHPEYDSTRHALGLGLPLVGVQHHLAHVLALLLEHGRGADGVLGVCWDGTGWGEDGTIWGGEFILLRRGAARRVARLRPFPLVGGDAAARDARRVAYALVADAAPEALPDVARRIGCSPLETDAFAAMLSRGLNVPVCSSMGRLFDGVGALLGLGRENAYEGQVPFAVEAAAGRAAGRLEDSVAPIEVVAGGTGVAFELDWRPTVRSLLALNLSPETAAAAFHQRLADALADVVRRAGVPTVGLTGGCFQNAELLSRTVEALVPTGAEVLVHRVLSPNDGSIAAGQALAALWGLTTVQPWSTP
jgi:hydrogenase maturation protein HypF